MTPKESLFRIKEKLRTLPMIVKVWAGVAILSVGFSACQSVNRTVLAVPQIQGAEFVGSEDCMLCHDTIGKDFLDTGHARLMVKDDSGFSMGCEACHGPGSLHSMEGEGRHLIHNPGRNPETCFQCHLDVQGQFALPHSHPLDGGKTTCIDCHDPHGKEKVDPLNAALSAPGSAGCIECHPSQSGPFVFEHEAMRDGCTTCHQPHGAPNDQLLKVRNGSLCLQCHFSENQNNAIMIGGVDHTGFGYLQQGTCWTAGCHEAIHGSQVNGSLRF